jgi:hypothetical protein
MLPREVFGAGVPLIEGARLLGDPVAVMAGIYHWLWRGELCADGLERVALSMATTSARGHDRRLADSRPGHPACDLAIPLTPE